jgi:hypothetical protein
VRAVPRVALVAVAVARAVAGAEEPDSPSPVDVRVVVDPRVATVGDPLDVRLQVELPPGTTLDPPTFGPALGPFSVVEGAWTGPERASGVERWTWNGTVVAFRTGPFELPPLRVVVEDEAGARRTVQSDPVGVTIASVLDDGQKAAELDIADLKPPAPLPPRYGAAIAALAVLLALLLAAAVLWWLHRRYAARWAAIPVRDDPFRRIPPHEWVYAELQKLLAQRLAERGEVVAFHAALARIVKRYLGGRYRAELLELTSAECRERLRRAGAPVAAVEAVQELLERCDLVKFAKRTVGSDDCRTAIEMAYRIVDATRARPSPVERGAA